MLRDAIPTPRALAEVLRAGRSEADVAEQLVPVLQRLAQQEELLTVPLGSTPPTVALLADGWSNPHVLKVVKGFFERSLRLKCTALSSCAAALAAAGLSSGIVVDVGRESTRCHAVIHGFSVPHAESFSVRGLSALTAEVRRMLLDNPVLRDRHGKRIAGSLGDALIDQLLTTSLCVAPTPVDRRPFGLPPGHAPQDVEQQRRAALDVEIPVVIRSDVVAVPLCASFEMLFNEPTDGDEGPPSAADAVTSPAKGGRLAPSAAAVRESLPLGALIAHTLSKLNPFTQLGDAAVAICIVGSVSDTPNFRRRLVEESLHYAGSAAFVDDEPARRRRLRPLLEAALVANVAPFAGWAAAALGGTVLLDSSLANLE